MPNKKHNTQALQSTAQRLGSLIKSCRVIMRKDKGLNGDLDRLPMLTWVMFLKFLDDMETVREEEAKLAGKKFSPAIDAPYRWRDWAANPQGITGSELIAFIGQDEATRPDGSRGPGLFAFLKTLRSTNGDRRDVIAKVFDQTANRMLSGYLLRDVINKVNQVHFTSKDQIHTLSLLYEALLRDMRDAAGDSGEFYTPRPLVKLIVTLIDPQLGETVLDPAAGTGGFLVESFEHIKLQCKKAEDFIRLQRGTLHGVEAKPLPFLLCQMNLLLHGLEYPEIDPGNALRVPLREIGDRDRVDIVVTNPPFGGEEEKGIQGNFPEDKQTTETALLFLQLIMRKLRRAHVRGRRVSRAAVVVPNGTLYATGVAERIRTELLSKFNLHTVVRLPKGVFEPYADIPTNVLFFDTSGPTKHVWFYEHPLPPSRAALRSPSYSQSEPLAFDEFQPMLDWWSERNATEQAWVVDVSELHLNGHNLDIRNPRGLKRESVQWDQRSSEALAATALIQDGVSGLAGVALSLNSLVKDSRGGKWSEARIDEVCRVVKGRSPTMKTLPGPYPFVVTAAERKTSDSYQFEGSAVCVPLVSSTGHGHAAMHRVHFESGRFAVASIMAALVVRDERRLLPKFLYYYLWRHKDEKLVKLMAGTANTSLTLGDLEGVVIAFPDLESQTKIVAMLDTMVSQAGQVTSGASIAAAQVKELVLDALQELT